MRQYVLRYKPAFQPHHKQRSERFPARDHDEALKYALNFVNARGHDLIILWEEIHVDSSMTPNGHTELITVYNPKEAIDA